MVGLVKNLGFGIVQRLIFGLLDGPPWNPILDSPVLSVWLQMARNPMVDSPVQ